VTKPAIRGDNQFIFLRLLKKTNAGRMGNRQVSLGEQAVSGLFDPKVFSLGKGTDWGGKEGQKEAEKEPRRGRGSCRRKGENSQATTNRPTGS